MKYELKKKEMYGKAGRGLCSSVQAEVPAPGSGCTAPGDSEPIRERCSGSSAFRSRLCPLVLSALSLQLDHPSLRAETTSDVSLTVLDINTCWIKRLLVEWTCLFAPQQKRKAWDKIWPLGEPQKLKLEAHRPRCWVIRCSGDRQAQTSE